MRHSSFVAGAERRAVVEIAAAIPVAVPDLASRARACSAVACVSHRAARVFPSRAFANGAKTVERRVQEPGEPDALAAPRLADAVHAVVPVAGADQRQAVFADGEALIQRARAVFEERRAFVRDRWLEVRIVIAGPQRLAFDERHAFVEHRDMSPVVST